MTVVLTICSANYLAHAKTLGQSLKEHNPSYHFVIGLVDRPPQSLGANYYGPFELIAVEDLKINDFERLAKTYHLVELNTAVKPFYFEYLYRRDPRVQNVFYLDPDIQVFDSLDPIVDTLREHPLVLTPHCCSPDDSLADPYYERAMLATGIYNLGFLGSSRSEETFAFLRWWQKRLREFCLFHPWRGLFVDQLWAVLAPLFYPSALVERNPGYNMAYWNLFERSLDRKNGKYIVNKKYPLAFYHFSGFKPDRKDRMATRDDVPIPTFAQRPDVQPLFEEYAARLLRNDYQTIRKFPYAYAHGRAHRPLQGARTLTRSAIRKGVSAMPKATRKWMGRVATLVASSCDGEADE